MVAILCGPWREKKNYSPRGFKSFLEHPPYYFVKKSEKKLISEGDKDQKKAHFGKSTASVKSEMRKLVNKKKKKKNTKHISMKLEEKDSAKAIRTGL